MSCLLGEITPGMLCCFTSYDNLKGKRLKTKTLSGVIEPILLEVYKRRSFIIHTSCLWDLTVETACTTQIDKLFQLIFPSHTSWYDKK